MNESRIKGAFETMHTTKEMDQRILAAVAGGQETGGREEGAGGFIIDWLWQQPSC